MKREDLLSKISDPSKVWDVVVIGGGATGLGVAVDAVTRGYSVALFEWEDFAKATSSRSTKLVHGGVRYLAQGDVSLVLEALYERGLLQQNAPHLVKNQSFLIPNYRYWDNFLYTVGLTIYDILAGRLSLGRSKYVSKKKTTSYLPTVRVDGLKGGVVYHDGQFDDSRLAVNLAQSCVENGGCPINRMKVTAMLHGSDGRAPTSSPPRARTQNAGAWPSAWTAATTPWSLPGPPPRSAPPTASMCASLKLCAPLRS